jgi:hypothetical protein
VVHYRPLEGQVQIPPIVGQFLANAIPQVAAGCQLPGCAKFSLGLRCAQCTRALCLTHAYVTPATKPQVICCSCIVDRHPEMFETRSGA